MKKKIETNFFCKSNHWPRRMNRIKRIVSNILSLDSCGFTKKNYYFLNLIFVDNKKIKNINKIYRNKNTTTDVLTFVTMSRTNIYNEAYCDIFFSAEMIKKDAKKNLINFYDHLTHLIIHCFLHINGYDHKLNSDFLKMKNLEKKILNGLGIKNPYQYD